MFYGGSISYPVYSAYKWEFYGLAGFWYQYYTVVLRAVQQSRCTSNLTYKFLFSLIPRGPQ